MIHHPTICFIRSIQLKFQPVSIVLPSFREHSQNFRVEVCKVFPISRVVLAETGGGNKLARLTTHAVGLVH